MFDRTCVWTSVLRSSLRILQLLSDVPTCFLGVQSRLSGDDLAKFQEAEKAFNKLHGAQVKTEHAFNGLGIIPKVRQQRISPYSVYAFTRIHIPLLRQLFGGSVHHIPLLSFRDGCFLSWPANLALHIPVL